jgi:TonB-linked SusC/RagA family outer membrane protein
VVVDETQQGAATAADGTYEITGVEAGTHAVTASFVGYADQTRQGIEVQANQTATVDFALEREAAGLDEVVVVGYGTQQRSSVTGSISSIDPEELDVNSAANVSRMLQGRAAGVRVSRNTGAPGEDARVRIRGLTGITESEPIYIVDGMPMESIGHINASNIASIEVLKDASSTAIYGARGADGVILISTKEGQKGETRVSFNVSQSVKYPLNNYSKLNAQQYMTVQNRKLLGDFEDPQQGMNQNRYYTQEEQQQLLNQVGDPEGANWFDAISRRGRQQTYDLSVSGGEENFNYFLSGDFMDERGVTQGSDYWRYSVRLNTEYQANDWLTVGENFSFTQDNTDDIVRGRGTNDIFASARRMPAITPTGTNPETGLPYADQSTGSKVRNPLGRLRFENDVFKENRLQGGVFARLTPIEGLTVESNLNLDWQNTEIFNWQEKYRIPGNSQGRGRDQVDRTRTDFVLWDIQNTVNYNTAFTDFHSIEVLGGVEHQQEVEETLWFQGSDFLNEAPFNRYISLAQSPGAGSGTEDIASILSYFGRLNYSYDQRYYLTLSARRDGSSRFGPNTRWGNFGSVSGAWRVHNESFMGDVGVISELKLRGGWGVTGSQSVPDPFAYLATLDKNSPGRPILPLGEGPAGSVTNPNDFYPIGNAENGLWPTSPNNPNLGWEEVSTINVGVDLGLFEDKLRVTAEYYERRTEDMLTTPAIPQVTGFSDAGFTNVGKFLGTGLDFDVQYQDAFGDLSYSISANGNIPFINNKLVDLGGQTGRVDDNRLVQEGEVYGAYYGHKVVGIFQSMEEVNNAPEQIGGETQPGDYRFKDLNQDGVIDADDRTSLGTPYADVNYGVNFQVTYQGFTVSALGAGKWGNQIISSIPLDGTTKELDRWTPDNRDATYARYTEENPNGNGRLSDRQGIWNASYFRLQSAGLSYRLPSSLLGQTPVSNARIYVQGNDLLTFTPYDGLDPEVSGSGLNYGRDTTFYPFARSYSVGVNVTF